MKKKIEVWDLCEYKINSDKKKKETLSHSLFKIFPFNSDTNDNLKLLIATESKIILLWQWQFKVNTIWKPILKWEKMWIIKLQ